MHDRVRPQLGKCRLDLTPITQVALDQLRPGINGLAIPLRQIVENRDLVALVDQQFRADAPDVTCAPRNQNLHGTKWEAGLRLVKEIAESGLLGSLLLLEARNHALHASDLMARS